MTTVYDVSLKVAKEVMDVIESTATGGSTTTLADTTLLALLPNDHFNNGRLWIKSGTHASKVFIVSDFATATGVVTFPSVTGAIVAGVRFAIARNTYPWDQILSAIQRALDSTWVTDEITLTGDGESLEYTLPTGVYNVKGVELEDVSITNSGRKISTHWKETIDGTLRFDYGYAPRADIEIIVSYRTPHAEIADYTTVINNEIDLEWLKYKAAYELLYNYGVPAYGAQIEYRVEERMNKIINGMKGKTPRREPDIRIHTAGG